MKAIPPFLCFAVALAGLFWQYPWSVEYEMFHFSKVDTLGAYVLTATVMTVIATGMRVVVYRVIPESHRFAAMTLGVLSIFSTLVLLALILGPFGANVPGTRIRGIFFAEWSFVSFILLSGPFAVVAVLLFSLPRRSVKRVTADPSDRDVAQRKGTGSGDGAGLL